MPNSLYVQEQTEIVLAYVPVLLPFLFSAPEKRRALDGRFLRENPLPVRFSLCRIPLGADGRIQSAAIDMNQYAHLYHWICPLLISRSQRGRILKDGSNIEAWSRNRTVFVRPLSYLCLFCIFLF